MPVRNGTATMVAVMRSPTFPVLFAALAIGAPCLTAAHPAPDGFADLAARLLPAVVNVSSSEIARADSETPETPVFPPGSPFQQFFNDFMNRHRNRSPDQPQGGTDNPDQTDPDQSEAAPNDAQPHRVQSLGSGFIIDPSGIIVTNNHVIDGADEISVVLQDNTTLKAKVIGHDDRTDLAVLRVTTNHKLPAVSFGDSDRARVGDWVLAIGNPFGLGGSVTAGIVSARGRDIQQGPYDDFIQTDAAINRGNSGGPLFNMAGEVIGINTAILSPSGGSIGLGFAIPSSEARIVIDQLIRYGRARRGWLGVRIQQVTPDIAESLGLHGEDGALVAGVTANGPADRAGIKSGDVILDFAGQKLHEMRTLPRVVAETPIASRVPVDIWRSGHQQTVQVMVAEMPEDAASPTPAVAHAPPPRTAVELAGTGLSIAALTPELRHKFRLDASVSGVVVTAVAAGSAASDRGLHVGDVIVSVQQQSVGSPAEVQKQLTAARTHDRKSVLLLVQARDGMRWVPLPVGRS